METDEESDMKISVKMPHEEATFGERYVSGTWPFILGFLVGVVVPIILLVCLKSVCTEEWWAEAFPQTKVLHYRPELGVFSFFCAVLILLLIYIVHFRFVRGVISEDRKRAKERDDFILRQVVSLKDVIRPPQTQQDKKIQKVEIDVKYHEGDSIGKSSDGVRGNGILYWSENTGDGAQLSSVNLGWQMCDSVRKGNALDFGLGDSRPRDGNR